MSSQFIFIGIALAAHIVVKERLNDIKPQLFWSFIHYISHIHDEHQNSMVFLCQSDDDIKIRADMKQIMAMKKKQQQQEMWDKIAALSLLLFLPHYPAFVVMCSTRFRLLQYPALEVRKGFSGKHAMHSSDHIKLLMRVTPMQKHMKVLETKITTDILCATVGGEMPNTLWECWWWFLW